VLSEAPPITTGSEEIRPKDSNKKSQACSLLGDQYRWCQLPELAHVRHRPPRQYRDGQAYYRLHSVLLSYTTPGSCARRRATWRSRTRSIHFFFSLSLSLLARASIVRMLRLHLLTRRRPLHARWRPLLPCAILLRASPTRMPAAVLFSRTLPCCRLGPPGSRSLTPRLVVLHERWSRGRLITRPRPRTCPRPRRLPARRFRLVGTERAAGTPFLPAAPPTGIGAVSAQKKVSG